MRRRKRNIKLFFIAVVLLITYVYNNYQSEFYSLLVKTNIIKSYEIENLPKYSGEDYIIINKNQPNFSEEDKKNTNSFEEYSSLDVLKRARTAYANIGKDLMPIEERGSIGMVKPTGWHTVKYDVVDGKYLYNRCHLIGYQLTGENANEKNLITCTRNMNANTMLRFEDKVAKYVKETNNHVLYRVSPVYEKLNLLATGVQIEAYSVEDSGKGINFNVFIYNVQDGIEINYENGESKLKK